MCWSRSMGRKRRSWTVRPSILSERSIRLASSSRRVLVAISKSSSRYAWIMRAVSQNFLPAESGFRLDVEIDFKSPAIGRQRRVFDLDPATFRREISRARTFGFVSDVQALVAGRLRAGLLARELRRHRRRRHPQSGRLALRRRVRATQGARCGRRSLARGCADHWPLPDLSSGTQAQRHGARGVVRASLSL